MRFMIMVKADADYEAGKPPTPELIEAIGKLGQREFSTGRMVEMGGLLPTSAGGRVRAARGRVRVTDGPFTEAKEVVGGYAVVEVTSRQEALEMAREFMQAHIDVLGDAYEGECEVRQLAFEPPPDVARGAA